MSQSNSFDPHQAIETNDVQGLTTHLTCGQGAAPNHLDLLFNLALAYNQEDCFRVLLAHSSPPKTALAQAIAEFMPGIARALFEFGEREPLSDHFLGCLMDSGNTLDAITFFWSYFTVAHHPDVMVDAVFGSDEVFSFFATHTDLTPTLPIVAQAMALGGNRAILRRLLPHLNYQRNHGLALQSLALYGLDDAMAEGVANSNLEAVRKALSTGALAEPLMRQHQEEGISVPAWEALDTLGTLVPRSTCRAWLKRHPGHLPRSLAKEREIKMNGISVAVNKPARQRG